MSRVPSEPIEVGVVGTSVHRGDVFIKGLFSDGSGDPDRPRGFNLSGGSGELVTERPTRLSPS